MSEYWGPGEHASFCHLGERHFGPCCPEMECPGGSPLSEHDDWPSCPSFDGGTCDATTKIARQ